MANSYLLVLRAGDRSLHPGWLDGARNWDLHISYFGDKEQPFAPADGVSLSREKGPKWLGLKDCLDKHPEFLARYSHIGFPDDDLACGAAAWNTAFEVLDDIGADLGQPALDPRSFFSYDITLRRRGLRYRQTDFVELMAPIFRVDFLREILPTWRLNKSSWGLDMVWREIARRERRMLAIVDAAGVLHTRAIGKGTQYSAANMQGKTPDEEYRALLEAYGISDTSRHSLRGETLDGRAVTRGLNRHLRLAGLRRNWRAWRGTAQIA